MSDRLRAACLNLFRVANAFRLALQRARPGNQLDRLLVESAWVDVLNEVDVCRRLAPLVPPSPLGDWLRATLLNIEDFRTSYVVPYGIDGCISGVPIKSDSRTVTSLQFPSLTIDPPPDLLTPSPAERREAPAPEPDDALVALLRVFTHGVADARLRQANQILTDDSLTANEKLTKIDGLIRFPPTASAEQLGEMLGVSKQAVMKTAWWRKNRRGMIDEEIERRRTQLTDRGRMYERLRSEEDEDAR